MPQLDVATYPSQLFWLFVTFLTLYFILSYGVVPRMTRFVLNRAEAIDGKLREASLLRQEAEVLLNDYERILANARDEARHRYLEVSSQVAKDISNQQKGMMEKITDRIRVAEQDLFRARADILKELKPQTVDIAQNILERLTGHKFAKKDLKSYQEKT